MVNSGTIITALIACWLLCSVITSTAAEGTLELQYNVSVTTKPIKKKSKTILDQVSGYVSSGKLHAILGPSGCGKSTLLNLLSGNTPKNTLKLQGEVYAAQDKVPIFVQQEDLFFAQLTVEETLRTTANLRDIQIASSSGRKAEKSSIAGYILDLGLKKVRKSLVGDAKTRGISGGEKKRLSIGNELLSQGEGANVIYCDEPTSGLDSFQAQRVMQLLKDLTEKGTTVVTSIHQPRASIYSMFDEITLLSEGRTIYTGTAADMPSYFAKLGYACPANINPAEFYVDLVSIDYSSPQEEDDSRARIAALADAQAKYMAVKYIELKRLRSKLPVSVDKTAAKRKESSKRKGIKHLFAGIRSSFQSFGVLYVRAWRQVLRDKSLNIARLMSGLFSGLLFGVIYFRMGSSAATVPDRLGLLQISAINTAMSALIKATTSFVNEKLIVKRERRTGAYSVSPYFLSKLAAEIPLSTFFPCLTGAIIYKMCGLNSAPGRLLRFLGILVLESFASTAMGMAVGSWVSSAEAGVAIAPALMTIFIVFGGLFVVNVPWYLRWIPNVSLIRWAYEALCINEFAGLPLEPQSKYGMLSCSSGDQVLESLKLTPDRASIGFAVKAQTAILVGMYAITYISLLCQRPSFDTLTDGSESQRVSEIEDILKTAGGGLVEGTHADDERESDEHVELSHEDASAGDGHDDLHVEAEAEGADGDGETDASDAEHASRGASRSQGASPVHTAFPRGPL